MRDVASERFGSVEPAIAADLALRYDDGPCFRRDSGDAEHGPRGAKTAVGGAEGGHDHTAGESTVAERAAIK